VGAEITRLGVPEQEGSRSPGPCLLTDYDKWCERRLSTTHGHHNSRGANDRDRRRSQACRDRLLSSRVPRFCWNDGRGARCQVLVPAKALAEVQRLAGSGKADDDRTIVFRHSDLDAVFDLVDVRITTRLLRGQFPEVERLIPTSYAYHLHVARDDLEAALRRVRLVVRDTKDATTPVRLALHEGGVDLTVLTPESVG